MNTHKFIPQDETKKYIEHYINLIEEEDFDLLYSLCEGESIARRDITDILLASGINPLNYMNYVPHSFARGSRRSMDGFIIPEGIKEIEGYAFSGTDIKSIIVPEGVTTIRRGAFSNCPELHTIWLPKSLGAIYEMVFNGSNNVTIYYNGTCDMWHQVHLKNKWKGLNDDHTINIACSDHIIIDKGNG